MEYVLSPKSLYVNDNILYIIFSLVIIIIATRAQNVIKTFLLTCILLFEKNKVNSNS